MLMPKRVKWRKQQRGRIRGNIEQGRAVVVGVDRDGHGASQREVARG